MEAPAPGKKHIIVLPATRVTSFEKFIFTHVLEAPKLVPPPHFFQCSQTAISRPFRLSLRISKPKSVQIEIFSAYVSSFCDMIGRFFES